MPTEKRVPSLIVNTLTEAQYQALENPSDTEMWVTPYDESILPSQTGQSGKFLTTDGTDPSWAGLPDITGKANVSLDNLTDAGKIVAAKASMPSSTYDTLTLGASGATYTAPADGYFVFLKNSTAAGQIVDMSIMTGTTANTYRLQTVSIASGSYCIQTVPAQKGAVLTVNYTLAGTGSSNLFRFVYAEGSKSEKA